MGEKRAVVIDLGGTKIAAAAVDNSGILKRLQRETADSLEGILRQIEEMSSSPQAVVVGVPGQVASGVVTRAPNLNWENVPLQTLLEERLHCPVRIENDVRLALLGEWRYGALRGVQNGILFYVGTGIGGGLIFNGALYRGASGCAGEIGHMRLIPDGERCGCGGRGCLETVSSGSAFKQGRFAKEPLIRAAISLVNLLNPEKLIFGGGVIEKDPELVDEIRKRTFEEALPQALSSLTIEKGELGSDAPLLGGATLLFNQ